MYPKIKMRKRKIGLSLNKITSKMKNLVFTFISICTSLDYFISFITKSFHF